MKPHGNRTRLAGVLVAVAAALALLALPGIASADHGHDSLADAGTIQSFDPEGGVLTIALTEGGSVSGLVTAHTHIHCDNGQHRGRQGLRHHLRRGATASHDGQAGGGGDRGRGEDESGDEHSARCSTDDLVAGTSVRFAELTLVDGKAIYSVVSLPEPAPEGEAEAPSTE